MLNKSQLYNKYYKFLLIIPIILFIFSFVYLFNFYNQNGDFIKKDVSLTGGTSITVTPESPIDLTEFQNALSEKIEDFSVREISDFNSGVQAGIIVESPADSSELQSAIESVLGYKLVSGENASIEFSGSSLSEGFYQQLLYAIILSFSFMAIVVFFIFGGSLKIKLFTIFLTLIPVILFFSSIVSVTLAMILSLLVLIFNCAIYLKYNPPSMTVIISAFADILMTLVVVNLLGMKVSTAGIISFLMLIGYSVDTDIMLTTRLLKSKDKELNQEIFGAFKTGITMTLTSIVAVLAALILTASFSEVLKQIFAVLLIGLIFDIINTWVTNASILKWYLEAKK